VGAHSDIHIDQVPGLQGTSSSTVPIVNANITTLIGEGPRGNPPDLVSEGPRGNPPGLVSDATLTGEGPRASPSDPPVGSLGLGRPHPWHGVGSSKEAAYSAGVHQLPSPS
jgi:hypothetical protein